MLTRADDAGSRLTLPVRVALISLHTDPFAEPGSGDVGGMNVVVRHTAEQLAHLGVDVEVLTRRSSPGQPDVRERAPRLTVRYLAAGPATPLAKGDHEAVIPAFAECLELLGPYDLVHSHHWFSGAAALPWARDRGIPHLQSFHSVAAPAHTPLTAGERPESPGRLAGERMVATHSDLIIAVSEAEAATAVERLGASHARIVVVHPGVDPDVFTPAVRGVAGAGGGVAGDYVLVAARLEPLKGVDLAIRAVAHVPEGERPVLVVAGGPTADRDYVDHLAQLARLASVDAEFIGPCSRERLARVMRGARVLMVPSHSETYGLVALEAAASGTPVIASCAGGLREVVRDGVTGLLLDTRDPAVWGSELARLLADPQRLAAFGEAGREHAVASSWLESARATLAAYGRATSGTMARAALSAP